MAVMDIGWRDAFIALLGVDFDDGFGKEDPPLEHDRLPNFRPYMLVGGVWEIAVAVTEAPGAALLNQLLFVQFRDRARDNNIIVML